MNRLNEEREILKVLEEKRRGLLEELNDIYELDEECETEEDILDCMYSGEISPEWYDLRNIEYVESLITSQKLLIRAIEIYEQGDKKALHKAVKSFETLVSDLRRIKKERQEDIRKAQEVIDTFDEIIKVCDEFRK